MGIILGIILGIIGLFLVIGLIAMIFQVIWFLLKWTLILAIPAGIVIGIIYLFTIIGVWALIPVAIIILILILVGKYGPEPLDSRIERYFQQYEMASPEDLESGVDGNPDWEKIYQVLLKMISKGKVELISLGQGNQLFRWTEVRDYPQGVITTHLTVD